MASQKAYTASEYQRNPDHIAKTGQDEDSYILALLTDKAHHKYLTSIRDKYFPSHINKLEAHVAMFRALPGSQLPRITQDLRDITGSHSQFQIKADRPFRLGHGIGVNVQRSGAEAIFDELHSRWAPFLSKQDNSFRAHYTVQNKVDKPEDVDKALDELRQEFHPSSGTVEGLALYKYVRGYWKDRQDFLFKS